MGEAMRQLCGGAVALKIPAAGRPFDQHTRFTAKPEGAAKPAANPAGVEPASRTCPVATVVIPDGRESNFF